MEPRPQRVADTERTASVREDEERGLKGVLGIVLVAEYGPADPQDHRAVPLDQDGERQLARLVAARREAIEELPVVQSAAGPDAEERLELPQRDTAPCCRHEPVLRRAVRSGL